MSRIVSEVKYSLLAFFRNKGNLFWTFGFPIVMFLLMGFMYSMQSGPMTLYYADNDHSQASAAFLDSLNATGAVALSQDTSANLAQSLKDGRIGAYIEIPAGFGNDMSDKAQLKLYYDPTQQSAMALISIVQQVADAYQLKNGRRAGAHRRRAADSGHFGRQATGLRTARHHRHGAHDVLHLEHGKRQCQEQGERRVPQASHDTHVPAGVEHLQDHQPDHHRAALRESSRWPSPG